MNRPEYYSTAFSNCVSAINQSNNAIARFSIFGTVLFSNYIRDRIFLSNNDFDIKFVSQKSRQMPWLVKKVVLHWLAPMLFCRKNKKYDDDEDDENEDGINENDLQDVPQVKVD